MTRGRLNCKCSVVARRKELVAVYMIYATEYHFVPDINLSSGTRHFPSAARYRVKGLNSNLSSQYPFVWLAPAWGIAVSSEGFNIILLGEIRTDRHPASASILILMFPFLASSSAIFNKVDGTGEGWQWHSKNADIGTHFISHRHITSKKILISTDVGLEWNDADIWYVWLHFEVKSELVKVPSPRKIYVSSSENTYSNGRQCFVSKKLAVRKTPTCSVSIALSFVKLGERGFQENWLRWLNYVKGAVRIRVPHNFTFPQSQ